MKVIRIVLSFALLVLAMAALAAPAASLAADSNTGEVLVMFQEGVIAQDQAAAHARAGGAVAGVIPGIDVKVVQTTSVEGALAAYRGNPKVKYAEVNGQYAAVGAPNDPNFGFQWGMTKAQAPQAWDVAKGSAAIAVAVLDTGIEASHPDLAGKVVSSVNFTSSATVGDVYGHGTHVAGTAAAATGNGVGVAGLGYNSTIQNVKVLGDNGSGSWSWIASGITWAADHGARVVNMSLGGTSGSDTVRSAVDYAWSKGVVVVAAAGNNGNSTPFYPASYTNVIAVAATDSADGLASFSNRGDWVDVAAPGSSILSTTLGGGYGYMSGTSMASPHVAGLAALVAAVGKTNSETRACIQSNADNIGVSGIGGGRINAYKAVLCSSPPPPSTGAIAGTVADAASATPIAGATVSAGSASATTSATGGYTLTGLAQGTYTVTASASGYTSASLSVAVTGGQTSAASFALAKVVTTGAIAGTVTDAATAAAIGGATVSTGSASATTDATGTYTLTGVAQGSYTVTASASGYNSASQSVSVTAGGTSTANFSLTQGSSTVSIVGTVTDAATASPIAGAAVSAGSASATTDATGNYALTGLASGTYTMTASASGYATASLVITASVDSTSAVNFTLLHPMTVASIKFKPAGQNLQISVEVDNWNGGPLVNATVYLEVKSPDATTKVLTGGTNTSGIATFTIQKAPKGTYAVTVKDVKAGANVWDGGLKSASYTLT